MRISEASFVVTDTETTGMRAGSDRLIEIGAVRVQNGMVVERFQELINPGCPIPGYIYRLTGISSEMVADRDPAEEVLPRYMSFLGDGVFVAHNLQFDLRFVNAELRDAQMNELPPRTLCTLRLARRLLPGLRSKSLASICEFFHIRNRKAHRALADAEATAEILLRFLEVLEHEHKVESVEELITFQRRAYRSISRSKHQAAIHEKVLPRLPSEPGVYFMKDAAEEVIYIGKARDLKARVTSYFRAIEGHPPRLRKMLEVVRDVSWKVTDSELDALILESRLIKERQPRFNRAQKQYQVRPFLRISLETDFPTVSVVPVMVNDGNRYYGPFDSRQSADRIAAAIERFYLLRSCDQAVFDAGVPCDLARNGRCCAPCAGFVNKAAYMEEVRRVEDFLEGRDDSVLDRIRGSMRSAAVEMNYEEAAILRDWMQLIEELLARDGCIAPSVLDQNSVLAHVGGKGDGAENLRLHLIRHGRLHESLKLSPNLSNRDRAEIVRCLDACFHPDIGAPDRYYVEETDEVRLIRQWAYANRSRVERVEWEDDVQSQELLERVVDAVNRLTSDVAGHQGATSSSSPS